MARFLQVIGRHLRQARRRRALVRRAGPGLCHHIARLDEFAVAATALLHQAAGARDELVDVELVVGEQHVVLEMLRAGRRVMRHAVQRIVDALRRERSQRPRLAERHLEGAVGDLVVGAVEVRHVEQVADRPLDALGSRAVDIGAFQEGEMQRDRRCRFRHRHLDAVIAHDEPKLLDEVVLEQLRLRDGGGKMSRRWHMAVGLTRVDLGERGRGDADLRIEGPVALALVAAGGEFGEGIAQELGVAVVKRLQHRDRLPGVVETFPAERLRHDDRFDCLGVDSLFHGPI